VKGANIAARPDSPVAVFEASRFVRYFAGSKTCSNGSVGTFKKNSSGVWNFMPILAARSLHFRVRILWLHKVIRRESDEKRFTCRKSHGLSASYPSSPVQQHHQYRRNGPCRLRFRPGGYNPLAFLPTFRLGACDIYPGWLQHIY